MLDLSGSGAPTSPAPLGTRYTDIATGSLWTMASTGWAVLAAGDTGWRQLPSGLRVRRVAAAVYIQMYGAAPAGTGNVDVDTLQVGFLPRWHAYGTYAHASTIRTAVALTSGVVRLEGVTASGAFTVLSMTWSTTDAWPATLPGTPVA